MRIYDILVEALKVCMYRLTQKWLTVLLIHPRLTGIPSHPTLLLLRQSKVSIDNINIMYSIMPWLKVIFIIVLS